MYFKVIIMHFIFNLTSSSESTHHICVFFQYTLFVTKITQIFSQITHIYLANFQDFSLNITFII